MDMKTSPSLLKSQLTDPRNGRGSKAAAADVNNNPPPARSWLTTLVRQTPRLPSPPTQPARPRNKTGKESIPRKGSIYHRQHRRSSPSAEQGKPLPPGRDRYGASFVSGL